MSAKTIGVKRGKSAAISENRKRESEGRVINVSKMVAEASAKIWQSGG
jgi:hypothetical protein